jgi:hypothetical protein
MLSNNLNRNDLPLVDIKTLTDPKIHLGGRPDIVLDILVLSFVSAIVLGLFVLGFEKTLDFSN